MFLSTKEANLSKFMQSFMTSFTVSYNRRYRSSGHLFQGRFKGLLVEEEGYGSMVSRYIHLNPVRTKAFVECDFEQKRNFMRDYKWSSYGAIIGLKKCPKWLDKKFTLKRWGKRVRDQQRNYSEYVESGLLKEIDDPFEAAAARSVLGNDRFIDQMRRGLSSISEKMAISKECGQAHQLLSWINIDELVIKVSDFYGINSKRLLEKHSKNNEARQILLYLAQRYCRGRYSLSEIASHLGGISTGGLSSGCKKMEIRLSADKGLARRLVKLEKELLKI